MGGGNLSLFLLAAVIIAAIPGPGIFYVAARTLSGGRQAGIASTFGTALGGLVHVIAGGVGVSAIILASAQLFTLLKLAGALYLIWLGIRTIREAGNLPPEQTGLGKPCCDHQRERQPQGPTRLSLPTKISKTTPCKVAWWSPAGCFGPIGTKRAFREGVLVEALNPKTAAFFLAFIPQFLEPAAGYPALQFMTLGLISVTLNTFADVIVVVAASTARTNLVRRPRLVQRLRQGSGLFMAGLGVSLALARRPATS